MISDKHICVYVINYYKRLNWIRSEVYQVKTTFHLNFITVTFKVKVTEDWHKK